MTDIFISYRRSDSSDVTGRIYDRLVSRFGRDKIFMDVDSIAPGLNFHKVINSAVADCRVLVAVIGRKWLGAQRETGKRTIDDVDDFVRLELEAAFSNGNVVVPVLVHDAQMPSAGDLPESLRQLSLCNAITIRSGPEFSRDTNKLGRVIATILEIPNVHLRVMWVFSGFMMGMFFGGGLAQRLEVNVWIGCAFGAVITAVIAALYSRISRAVLGAMGGAMFGVFACYFFDYVLNEHFGIRFFYRLSPVATAVFAICAAILFYREDPYAKDSRYTTKIR